MGIKTVVEKPQRELDHISKRGVPYWFYPEWVRATSSAQTSFGRIIAIKNKNGDDADLYMESKTGSRSYIQGSIQQEFKQWHIDRKIDYILLGGDPDELLVRE